MRQVWVSKNPRNRIVSILATVVFALLISWVPAASAQDEPGGADVSTSGRAQLALAAVPAVSGATGQAETRAWQVLSEGLASPKASRRMNAITALATIPDNERAASMVAACLKDTNSQVRQLAARTLGEMQSISAIPDLKSTLEDHSDEVSFAAAVALAELGDYTGRRILFDVLNGKRHAGPGVIESQKRALAQRMSDPVGGTLFVVGTAAGPLLPGAGIGIRTLGGLAGDHTSPGKMEAAKMLASDPDPETARQLGTALSDKSQRVRATAAKALGEQDSPDSISKLEPSLNDHHSAVRDMAAASIVRLSQANGARTRLHAVR